MAATFDVPTFAFILTILYATNSHIRWYTLVLWENHILARVYGALKVQYHWPPELEANHYRIPLTMLRSTTPTSSLKTRLSAQELADLTHVSHIMHLAHHRNKNQHRRAHWYRHLSLLRRHISRVVALHTDLATVPDTHAARHRKLKLDQDAIAQIKAELLYLADVLLPRCQRAFGQLVADGRFAVLGVVLVAALAQVCSLMGVTAAVEEATEREVGEVLSRFEREEWGEGAKSRGQAEAEGRRREENGTGRISETGSGEDVGVVVERGVVGESHAGLSGEADSGHILQRVDHASFEEAAALVPSSPISRTRKRKKKHSDTEGKRRKRQGGDAIDDLFAGL